MSKSTFAQELEPNNLFPAAMIGLVIGAVTLPLLISFSVLIYSGNLSDFTSRGVGFVLVGAVIMYFIVAFVSSVRGMVGGPQDSPAAIMALAAAAIAGQANVPLEARFATVVGEIGLYLKTRRTASVVAAEPTVLYRLSSDALKNMEKQDPELASRLHRWVVLLLADRLADNNRTLEALLN